MIWQTMAALGWLAMVGALFWGWRLLQAKRRCVTENEELRDKLQKIRMVDETTGVLNYQAFVRSVHIQLRLAHRHKWPVSLLLIDIIDLERINFKRGFKVGNTILKAAADAIHHGVRASDVVGRFEGSRFYVMLQECGEEYVPTVVGRILAALEASPPIWNDEPVSFDLRVVAISSVGEEAYLAEMIKELEKGLEQAKERGEKFVRVKRIRKKERM
jgi:diguanylate cyclase (GGDEF)-like protein